MSMWIGRVKLILTWIYLIKKYTHWKLPWHTKFSTPYAKHWMRQNQNIDIDSTLFIFCSKCMLTREAAATLSVRNVSKLWWSNPEVTKERMRGSPARVRERGAGITLSRNGQTRIIVSWIWSYSFSASESDLCEVSTFCCRAHCIPSCCADEGQVLVMESRHKCHKRTSILMMAAGLWTSWLEMPFQAVLWRRCNSEDSCRHLL